MKKSIGEKYFNQKDLNIFDIICIAVMAVSVLVATFVWGGGPTGITLLGISALLFIISRSTRVKDSEIDDLIKKLSEQSEIDASSKNAISAFDLKKLPVVKGKDGTYRSSIYVVSFFDISDDRLKLTVYSIDLISAEVRKNEYNLTGEYRIELAEENIKVNKNTNKKANYLVSDCFERAIPVMLDDIDSSKLIEKICKKL